jgi:hypothetical protein
MNARRSHQPPAAEFSTSTGYTWLFFVLMASAVTAILVFSGVSSALRAIAVFGFMLFVPGWSFIRLLRLNSPMMGWTLAVTLSLALDAVIAMILLFADAWSAQTGLILLIGISILGARSPACRRKSALSVRSQVRSRSSRPKWP